MEDEFAGTVLLGGKVEIVFSNFGLYFNLQFRLIVVSRRKDFFRRLARGTIRTVVHARFADDSLRADHHLVGSVRHALLVLARGNISSGSRILLTEGNERDRTVNGRLTVDRDFSFDYRRGRDDDVATYENRVRFRQTEPD